MKVSVYAWISSPPIQFVAYILWVSVTGIFYKEDLWKGPGLKKKKKERENCVYLLISDHVFNHLVYTFVSKQPKG